jgi:hypothetical protein
MIATNDSHDDGPGDGARSRPAPSTYGSVRTEHAAGRPDLCRGVERSVLVRARCDSSDQG